MAMAQKARACSTSLAARFLAENKTIGASKSNSSRTALGYMLFQNKSLVDLKIILKKPNALPRG